MKTEIINQTSEHAEDLNYECLRTYISENSGKYNPEKNFLIPLLHKTQEIFGYIPEGAMHLISETIGVSLSHIYGVVTFYSHFSLIPQAKYKISVCNGTACYIAGSNEVLQRLKMELGISEGETTADRLFGLGSSRCLGCCGQAPVVQINKDLHVKVKPGMIPNILETYRKRSINSEKNGK